jgi:hypothetical protein
MEQRSRDREISALAGRLELGRAAHMAQGLLVSHEPVNELHAGYEAYFEAAR